MNETERERERERTKKKLTALAPKMRTERSYPPATNSLPVGDQSTEVTADTKSWCTHVAPLENIRASKE